eukprot:COSAG01_NODE_514_length_16043_cov_248.614212_15_plen_319_part_00
MIRRSDDMVENYENWRQTAPADTYVHHKKTPAHKGALRLKALAHASPAALPSCLRSLTSPGAQHNVPPPIFAFGSHGTQELVDRANAWQKRVGSASLESSAVVNGKKGGKEAGRRLKAAAAGDYAGHLAESHATVAAGTADAQHRQHAGQSDSSTEAGRRLKAAAAGDYAGHLAESHAAVAAGTADAQHRQHAGQSDGGTEGGKEAGRRLKAAAAGDYEGHLAESHAAVAAGTADAQHQQHAGQSDGGKEGGTRGSYRTPVCSYRRKNNKLSAKAICFDPNCKSARSCRAAKAFIARRDSRERAAKRARNEREMNSFD